MQPLKKHSTQKNPHREALNCVALLPHLHSSSTELLFFFFPLSIHPASPRTHIVSAALLLFSLSAAALLPLLSVLQPHQTHARPWRLLRVRRPVAARLHIVYGLVVVGPRARCWLGLWRRVRQQWPRPWRRGSGVARPRTRCWLGLWRRARQRWSTQGRRNNGGLLKVDLGGCSTGPRGSASGLRAPDRRGRVQPTLLRLRLAAGLRAQISPVDAWTIFSESSPGLSFSFKISLNGKLAATILLCKLGS